MKRLFQHIAVFLATRYVLPTIIVLFVLPTTFASAQWTLVAPNLLGTQGYQMSCITHRSGIVWAGTKEVFMSQDLGATWQKRSPTLFTTDLIRHINFYDANVGIVGTQQGHVFLTNDRGLTWREIRLLSVAAQSAFLGSPDNIVVATAVGGEIHSTRDGGATWTIATPGTYIPDIKPLLGSGAYAIVGYTPTTTGVSEIHLMKSNDYGVTWTQMAGRVDFDTYGFDVDPCSPNDVYVINEDGTTSRDDFAQIFSSTDAGNSWNVSRAEPITSAKKFFCGSVCIAGQAIFAQTVGDGVWRSTDKGASWKSIGGPTAPFDTRLVTAFNENLVFAADANGSIWRTGNSGGDSLKIGSLYESLSSFPNRLFTTDSLLNCDTPVIQMIRLTGNLCIFPKVIGEAITGRDSLDYKVVRSIGDSLRGNDSATISFKPRGNGDRRGYYTIYLEDGSEISIPLFGFGKKILYVELGTANGQTDTIGGAVAIPINLKGFDKIQDVEFVLHYDTALTYLGAYSNAGIRLDKNGDTWLGGSRIGIDKTLLRLDTASGFAYFIVWPSDKPCPKVTFDSLTITSPIPPCTYTLGAGVEAIICPPKGCGIIAIANFMRYGTLPQLRMYPNPTAGDMNIISSADIPDANLKVFDANGKCWITEQATFKKQSAYSLNLAALPSGSYHLYITTRSGSLRTTISVVK